MKIHKTLFFMLLIHSLTFPGFIAETLVKTPHGYKEIQSLKKGDLVYGVSQEGHISITSITHTTSYSATEHTNVTIESIRIITACKQKFFLPFKDCWCKAQDLAKKNLILTAQNQAWFVESVQPRQKSAQLYEIRLQNDHAFCISTTDIIVHNCPLFNIGMLVTWGCGKVAIESVYFSICLAGWLLSIHLWGSKSDKPTLITESIQTGCGYTREQQSNYTKENIIDLSDSGVNLCAREVKAGCNTIPSQHQPGQKCGALACPAPRPGPHGAYLPSPKHGSKQEGSASPGPSWEVGQKALDESIPVEDTNGNPTKQRVAVWNGDFIVFKPTGPNTWHGYYTPWR